VRGTLASARGLEPLLGALGVEPTRRARAASPTLTQAWARDAGGSRRLRTQSPSARALVQAEVPLVGARADARARLGWAARAGAARGLPCEP
jgi:hypothetical protein